MNGQNPLRWLNLGPGVTSFAVLAEASPLSWSMLCRLNDFRPMADYRI